MLFCCRTSGVMTIRRRGVRDTALGVDYYAEWMEGQKGRKVYLRRDPQAMEEAWVFDAATDTYIDNAVLIPEVPALATDAVSHRQLKEWIAVERRAKKIIRTCIDPEMDIPFDERMAVKKLGTKVLNERRGYTPTPTPEVNPSILVTTMDHAAAQHERNRKVGTQDLSMLAKMCDDKQPLKPVLFMYESQKQEAEALKIANE